MKLLITCVGLAMAVRLGVSQVPASLVMKVLPEPQSTDWSEFGAKLALGDVDNDGDLDLAVGMPSKNTVGGARILYGPNFTTSLEVVGPTILEWSDGWTGDALELFDVNRDGWLDLVTRDRDYDNANNERAWIVFGPGFNTYQKFTPPAGVPNNQIGVDSAFGDFDGDGLDDVVLSLSALPPEGGVLLYPGSAGAGVPPIVYAAPWNPPLYKNWGLGLGMFDIDHDGDRDIVTTNVGLLGDVGQFAYFDHANPTVHIVATPTMSPVKCDVRGANTLHFTDLNGDGFEDLMAIGEPPKDSVTGLAVNTKSTLFIAWGPTYATGRCVQHADIGLITSSFGTATAVGDMNRDGHADLVAGDPFVHLPQFDWYSTSSEDGRVTIFYGPDFTVQQDIDSIQPKAILGYDIEVADLDGNGFPELFIGVPGADVVLLYQHESLRALTPPTLSATTGGAFQLGLECGALSADEDYLVLTSVSGSAPGLTIPSGGKTLHLPLNFDVMTDIGLAFVNTPFFTQFLGQLDAEGMGLAQFTVPAHAIPPAAVGIQFTFAALTFAGAQPIRFITNPVTLTTTP